MSCYDVLEVSKMSLGNKIKEKRKQARLTQPELAEEIGVSLTTLRRWEGGKTKPDSDNILLMARILNTSTADLLGETDDPLRPNTSHPISEAAGLPEADIVLEHTNPMGWRELPLLSKMTSACAGSGNGLAFADEEIESRQYFPAEIYGKFDPRRPPFMIHVEGDSMEDADIHDGAVAVINPAEEVYDGDSALVCWNQDQVAIKLIYWQPNGGVELHAANPKHSKVYTFSKEDCDEGNFVVKGKVMWSGQRPRRMR